MIDGYYEKTHRCEKSLKRKCSIRYGDEFEHFPANGKKAWYLRQLVDDYEYYVKYLAYAVEIEYCPFCGEKLLKEGD